MIQKDILLTYGAVYRQYKHGEIIFMEGENPQYYFQVVEGCVKMVNVNDEGKEFIQGFFHESESFAEPVLFLQEPYPATAMAETDCVVIRLLRDNFHKILHDFPDLMQKIVVLFSQRLYQKSIMSREIAVFGPEHRILTILKKHKKGIEADDKTCKINLTRQQIADMTALRVETVIRTMKEMEKKGLIKIEGGKVYL